MDSSLSSGRVSCAFRMAKYFLLETFQKSIPAKISTLIHMK